ncbi:MAG: HDOD domain-containing protein [Candidatus Lindowbacteria bacterium]|nr:HDOD domain-containing protein [Candidatus Lindowbacteria bacterium]
MAYTREQLRAKVEEIRNLPTIAKIAMKTVELATKPDVSMSDLGQIVHQDPSLAARILSVANSPFFGMARQVDSLRTALGILGLTEVQNILFSLSIFKVAKNADSHITYDREKLCLHSAACGMVANILASQLGLRNDGADVAAGLLHDVGKIIIDERFRPEFVQIFERAIAQKKDMREAETEILGASHAQIGAWLAKKWRLPDALCEAIEHHHELPASAARKTLKDPELVALLHLAEAFCQCYEIGWDGDSHCCDVKESEAWEWLFSGQAKYTMSDIDQILAETLCLFHGARPQMFWK